MQDQRTEATRAIAYIRVSTAEQRESGAGLDAQRAALEAEAGRRRWALEVVADEGYSGKTTNRPGLRWRSTCLSVARPMRSSAPKTDRVSRSLADWCSIMGMAQRQGWALLALDCPVDLSTPTGEAMASIMATFSQLERRLVGQRTREALAAKRAAGVRLGRPTTLPGHVLERIDRERAEGRTLAEIADGLELDRVPTAHGGARWWPATVAKVLARAEVVAA